MRLATVRFGAETRAVRVEAQGTNDVLFDLGATDVGSFLRLDHWRPLARDATSIISDSSGSTTVSFAPVVPRPEKIICVGLNYRGHILEMGRELPSYPTLFAKYSRALIGATDVIRLPKLSSSMDWEGELALVIGATVRNVSPSEALEALGGYTLLNDVSARDWQNRTAQWLQGKTFEATTPVGPCLYVPDDPRETFAVTCEVNGEVVQRGDTSDLVFGPAELIAYISSIITLVPGDIIATGTPSGVGHARNPQRYLRDGDVLVTSADAIGTCTNTCRAESIGSGVAAAHLIGGATA